MSIADIIRAWRDKEFRESLTEEQQALLPKNPIGEVLSQEQLLQVSGGRIKQNDTDPGMSGCANTKGECQDW